MLIHDDKYDIELKLAFAKELSELPVDELIAQLSNNLLPIVVRFNDLQYWVPLLDRFDKILESQIKKYHLSESSTKLLEISSKDEHILVTVLKFTESLLLQCMTKPLYNSQDRLYDLINTPNVNVRYHALRNITLIANRLAKRKYIKFTVPWIVKKKVGYLASGFPPEIPITSANSLNENVSLYDILANEKSVPAKWRQLDFKYFKSTPASSNSNAQSKAPPGGNQQSTFSKPKTDSKKSSSSIETKKSKKAGKRKTLKQNTAVEGVFHFVLNEDEVRKLSFQQIYDKATSSVPEGYFFKFGTQLAVAKAFNNKSYECLQLREKLVQIKIIATACDLLINDSTSLATDQLMSESDENSIISIIDLIKPENQEKVGASVYHDSMFSLSCISSKKYLRSDLLRLLSARPNHGLLFKILRSIYKSVEQTSDSISVHELSIHDNKFEDTRKSYGLFLQLIDNLVEIKSTANFLITGGLLNQLIDFLPLRSSKYKSIIAYASNILKALIVTNLDNLDPFISREGFKMLIDAVGDQVEYILKNQNLLAGLEFMRVDTKKFDVKVLDENDLGAKVLMKEREISYMRSLIRFSFDLIRTDSGDRMRNLFDSPLLKSFNEILVNGKLFGTKVLTNTLSTVTSIIHNEPTSFPILLESETIDTVLNHFSEFFMDNGYLILALPEIIGAICLNRTGLGKVKESGVITKFFDIFKDVKISNVLVNEEASASIATAFDELGRHYAELKPEIVAATKKLIETMPLIVSEKMKGVQFYKSTKRKNLYYSDSEPLDYKEEGFSTIVDDIEEDLYMLENAASFIYTALNESEVWKDILDEVKDGKAEFASWLPFLVYEKAPYDHINSSFYFSIVTTVKSLEDTKKGFGFDILFKKISDLLNDPMIKEFINWQNKPGETFFARFDNDDPTDQRGSVFLRKLNQLSIAMNSLVEIYMHAEGVHPTRVTFLSKKFAGQEGLNFIQSIVKLFERIAIEEILIRENLPPQVAQVSLPSNQFIYSPQLVIKSPLYNREFSVQIEKTSPKIKNTMQIRCIMEDIQSSIGCCLAVMPKLHVISINKLVSKEDCVVQLKNSITFNQYLAKQFTEILSSYKRLNFVFTPLQVKNYLLVMLHLFDHILCRKSYWLNNNQTPFGLYFMQNGGFIILRNVCLDIFGSVKNFQKDQVDKYSKKLNFENVQQNDYCITVAFLKKAFSIFARISSTESTQEFPFKYAFSSSRLSILKAFMVQAKIASFGLLVNTFESTDNLKDLQKLPLELLVQLLNISVKLYAGNESSNLVVEDDSILYPLTEQTLCATEEKVNYLKSLGCSDEEAKTWANRDVANDLFDRENVPENILDDEERWKSLKQQGNQNKFTPIIPGPVEAQFGRSRTLSDLYSLREKYENLVFNNWLKSMELRSDIISSVAKFLAEVAHSKYGSSINFSPLSKVTELLISYDENSSTKSSDIKFSSLLKLAATLLENTKILAQSAEVNTIIEYLDSYLSERKVNTGWFGSALSIYEKILSTSLIPSIKKSSKVAIPIEKLKLDVFKIDQPYEIPAALKQRVLEFILSRKEFEDIETAGTAAKILILYLQNPEYLNQVFDSEIVLVLLRVAKLNEAHDPEKAAFIDDNNVDEVDQKIAKDLESDKEEKLKTYKFILTALIRRLFETQDFIKKIISQAMDKDIKTGTKRDRYGLTKGYNLIELSKDNASSALRDPSAFVESASSKVILTTPQNPLASYAVSKAPKEQDKKDGDGKSAEDAPMVDASTGRSVETQGLQEAKKPDTDKPSTGIMRILLSELMSIKPSEWTSDTLEQIKLYDELKNNPKKNAKAEDRLKLFKNPKHSYMTYLLSIIVELLSSYKQSKLEFLTFSKKVLQKGVSLKPRSTALNFFLHQLIPTHVFTESKYNENIRRSSISRLAKYAILSLLSTTNIDAFPETGKSTSSPPKEDTDMIFIRKFSVDIISKAIKESSESKEVADIRYSKIVNLAELCSSLLYPDFGTKTFSIFDEQATQHDAFFICKAMIERSIPSQIASILTTIDLNFPGVKKVAKTAIRLLNVIGSLKSNHQDLFKNCSDGEEEEEVDAEDYDSHDEITQLFRNSSLGMYDVGGMNSDEDSDEFEDEDSDIVIYSDEIEDELEGPGEEYESDHGSVMEIDVDLDDEPDEIYEEGGPIEVSLDDSLSHDDSDADDEYDSGHEDGDIEIIEEIDGDDLEGESDNESHSDGFLSGTDYGDEEDDGDEDGEGSSSDYSEIIDQWVDDYENERANNRRSRALPHSSVDLDPSAEMSILRMLETFSNDLGRRHHLVHHRNVVDDPGNNNLNSFLAEEDEDEEEEEDEDDAEDDEIVFEDDGHEGIRDVLTHRAPIGGRNRPFQSISRRGRDDLTSISRGWRERGILDDNIHISIGNDVGRGWPRLEGMFNSRAPKRFDRERGEFRSTMETWIDTYKLFFSSDVPIIACRLIPAIVEEIFDQSKQLSDKKEEEKKRKEKEAEEKRKREEEERKKKQEEEERQRREEEAQHEHEEPPEPVMVEIGDRQVDIAGTGIDLEFLLALPMEMREEVYSQHTRNMNQTSRSNEPATDIDPDFLDALPDQIREEVLAQQAQIFNGRSNLLRNLVVPVGEDIEEEDRDEDIEEDQIDEAQNEVNHGHGNEDGNVSKRKVYFTPLVDKSAVDGIIRLVFVKHKSSHRDPLYNLLEYLCYSKQTRSETISLLLYILQEGINDQKSLEKAFVRISNRATSLGHQKGASSVANSSTLSAPMTSNENRNSFAQQFPINATPIDVAVRVFSILNHLLDNYPHLRYYFLSEHESSIALRKLSRSKSRSSDTASVKDFKYPINILLSLIDKPLVKKERVLMDLLSKAIRIATSSLAVIEKAKEKEKEQEKEKEKEKEREKEKEKEKDEAEVSNSDAPDASQGETADKDDASKKKEPESKDEVKKPIKQFDPPAIPNSNLSLVVSILIAGDCSGKAFQQALTTMRNLSFLVNSKQVFASELSSFATSAGKLIVSDLKNLADAIAQSCDAADIDEKVLAKLTSSDSTQHKLLRALVALDYLFDNKKEGGDFQSLTSLYEKLALGPLWGTLSDCLRGLKQNKALYNVATILLPLIESLMVVCKHSKVKDLQAKDTLKYESKAPDFTNEPIERLFFSFTNEHKTILNEMVRKSSHLMNGPFAMLIRNPKVLEFDNKKSYFDGKLHSKTVAHTTMPVKVSRERVFLDSYRACAFKGAEEFRNAKLDVMFKGEQGVDAGGVTREWYQVLSRQIFNPDYALFIPVASDRSTFHPNRTSWVNSEHLLFFKFIGRILGKAIYDNQYLDAHFSRAVYKRLLGRPVSLKDMETLDLDYFKSLMWMLENDITDIITETFSMETDDYGEHKILDLKPGGRDIPVTEENKQEYVKLVVEYRLQESVKEQMEQLIKGFHEIVPKDLISIFDEQELELLISGLPDIDVDDWKNNTSYNNYSPSTTVIQWFWRAVKSFDNEQKAKLLQFVTGTSKVPLQGFSALAGVNGTQKFSIHRDYSSLDRLPSAHTCFNQLDLPPYETYEQLRGSLLLAITEGHEGFGFA